MKRLWAPLVVLALIATVIPAAAQDDAQASEADAGEDTQANAALDVIDQFGEATKKMMRQEDTDFAFEDALVLPEDTESQVRVRSAMLLLQMTLAAAPTPQNVTSMKDDTAVVTMQPEPMPFVLRKVDGQWKIDLAATVDRLPENAKAVVEPTEEQMAQEKKRAETRTCYNHLRELGRAALMYAQNNDRTLPDADKWMDQVKQYVSDKSVFQCPTAGDADYGYAMNEHLSGMNVDDIESLAGTVLFFESTMDTRNAAGTADSIPQQPRHSMGNGFVYADGHVELQKDTPNFDPGAEVATEQGAGRQAPSSPPAQ